MPALTSQDVVSLWEQGEALLPVEQSLLVLERAFPQRSPVELAALPIGQRNALLLHTRAATFGDVLRGNAPCTQCQTPLSFALGISQLLAVPEPKSDPQEVRTESVQGELRLPTSADLLAAAQSPPAERGSVILARCVVSLRRGEQPVSAADLTAEERAELATQLAQKDPLAELQLNLVCPSCRCSTPQWLDIGAYFFAELTHHALRLLAEVELLARSFGWREPDVLALSPRRRRHYVEAAAR